MSTKRRIVNGNFTGNVVKLMTDPSGYGYPKYRWVAPHEKSLQPASAGRHAFMRYGEEEEAAAPTMPTSKPTMPQRKRRRCGGQNPAVRDLVARLRAIKEATSE